MFRHLIIIYNRGHTPRVEQILVYQCAKVLNYYIVSSINSYFKMGT